MTMNEQLHNLIDRYFEGETTLDQERQLRQLLAATTDDSPDIAGARAVLGVTKKIVVSRRRPYFKRFVVSSVAASIIVAVLIGGAVLSRQQTQHPVMMAYVGGEKTTDTDDILAIMHSQLNSISTADREVNAEIDAQLTVMNDLIDNL